MTLFLQLRLLKVKKYPKSFKNIKVCYYSSTTEITFKTVDTVDILTTALQNLTPGHFKWLVDDLIILNPEYNLKNELIECLNTDNRLHVANMLIDNNELFNTHFIKRYPENSFKWVLLELLLKKSSEEVSEMLNNVQQNTENCATIFTQPITYLIECTHVHKSSAWLMDTLRLYCVNKEHKLNFDFKNEAMALYNEKYRKLFEKK